jgi:hypothetical protein
MRELSMKYHIAAGLVVATAIAFSATAASAVNKPVSLPQVNSAVEKVACTGHLRSYNNFEHCMTFKRNTAKYCSKICS